MMNYAKPQLDMVIMAVNTFVKDYEDPNPVIRALAVRTMGCIRVDKITEYPCEPLRKCLEDEDPYVRKTAAVSVAKSFKLRLFQSPAYAGILGMFLSMSGMDLVG